MNINVSRTFAPVPSECVLTAKLASRIQFKKQHIDLAGSQSAACFLRPIRRGVRREYKVSKHAFRAVAWGLPYSQRTISLPFHMVESYRTVLLRKS